MNREGGFILLDKPAGLTSFSAVQQLKRKLSFSGKAGHAGTLDSFATGLLICLTGSYTSLSDYFMAAEKTYAARFCFGKETDTLDPTGTVIRTAEIPNREMVEEVLKTFTGTISQVPPLYSAVHINGKRAWERVRNNETIVIEPRSVTIFSLQMTAWDPPCADFLIHCSKGTYIRSLARDVAISCGSCAHVEQLERVSIGSFSLKDSVTLEAADNAALRKLNPDSVVSLGLKPVSLSGTSAKAVLNGKQLEKITELKLCQKDGMYAAFAESGELCALLELLGGKWRYERVLQAVL